MVRYLDPEDHPELGEERAPRSSPGERLARARERNAALSGTEAVEAARERAELVAAMVGRGFRTEVAEEVVARLEAVGLVDDQAYADALVRSRFAATGASGRALRDMLSRKGLGADVIERAVAQSDHDDEEARADDLVARRRRSLRGVSRQTAYRRLASMLARKGYSPSVASAAVSRALASWESEERGQEEQWDTP